MFKKGILCALTPFIPSNYAAAKLFYFTGLSRISQSVKGHPHFSIALCFNLLLFPEHFILDHREQRILIQTPIITRVPGGFQSGSVCRLCRFGSHYVLQALSYLTPHYVLQSKSYLTLTTFYRLCLI